MRMILVMLAVVVLSACSSVGGGNVVERSIGVGPEDNAVQVFCGSVQGRWTSTDAATARIEFPQAMDLSQLDPAALLQFLREQCPRGL